jgi:hypothetical protein
MLGELARSNPKQSVTSLWSSTMATLIFMWKYFYLTGYFASVEQAQFMLIFQSCNQEFRTKSFIESQSNNKFKKKQKNTGF